MELMDANSALLVLVVLVPVLGAVFALAMPGDDRIALRQVGMGGSIGGGVCALACLWRMWTGASNASRVVDVVGVPLGVDGLTGLVLLSLVVVVPIALRAGAPRVMERTQFYVVTVLFAQATLAAAILVEAPIVRLGIASVSSVPLFCLVALFGGPMRGTTTYRAALIWFGADLMALSVLVWLASIAEVSTREANASALARAFATTGDAQPWIALALCAPGLVRLAAGPFSVWLQSFLDEAPVSAACLAAGGVAPFGALLVVDLAVPVASAGVLALAPGIAWVCAAAALLAGVISLAERDLRRILAQLLFLVGATTAPALVAFDVGAVAVGLVHVIVAGASACAFLIATDAIERRYESRDATGLVGLSTTAPMLAAAAAFGIGALVGIPGLGAGRTLWGVLHGILYAPAIVSNDTALGAMPPLSAAWIVVVIAVAHVLAAIGCIGLLRRMFSPPMAKKKIASMRVNPGQAVRLFIPALWALALGLAAPALVRIAEAGARTRVPHVERAP